MSLIVMGIHTGVGKTLCSAILCQALGYEYWKPVQAGNLDSTDSDFIRTRVTHPLCKVHREAFAFALAASPHHAASDEGVYVSGYEILERIPKTKHPMVIETAGGAMTPLSLNFSCTDFAEHFGFPVVLVVRDYLGCINHSLLTVEHLRQRGVELAGIVFSGKEDTPARAYILGYTRVPLLFTIPHMESQEAEDIRRFSKSLSLSSLR